MNLLEKVQNYKTKNNLEQQIQKKKAVKTFNVADYTAKQKDKEMYEATMKDAEEMEKRAEYLNSPIGQLELMNKELPSSIVKVGKGILNFGKETLQFIPRETASVGLTSIAGGVEHLGPTITGVDEKIFEKKAKNIRTMEVNNPVARGLFGTDEIKSLETRIAEGELQTKDVAEKVQNLPIAYGDTVGNFIKDRALPLSFLGVGLSTGMNFVGGGGGKALTKKAFKAGMKEALQATTKQGRKKGLKKIVAASNKDIGNLADNIVGKSQKEAEDIVTTAVKAGKETSEKQMSASLKRLDEISETVKTDAGKARVVKQRFRADKLNLSKTQEDQINKRVAALGLKQRKVRTFGRMQDTALELGTTPERLLKDITNNRITDGEVVGLKNLINTQSRFIARANGQIKNLSSSEAKTLEKQISTAESQIDEALKKLIRGGTEAGRTVASFKMIGRNSLEPTYWLAKARKLYGKDLGRKTEMDINEMIDKGELNALAHYVTGLEQTSNAQKLTHLWKTGLLTSPTTQMANYGGNITMASLESLSDLVAMPYDALTALATGKRTAITSPSIVGKKAFRVVEGITDVGLTTITSALSKATKGKIPVKSLKTGAGEYLKTGIYSQELLSKYDINHRVVFEHNFLNNYSNAVFRQLGAGDIVFRRAAMEESLEKQARLIAKNEGLTGTAAKKRIKELLISPTNSMQTEAIDAAEYATFLSDNPVAEGMLRLKGLQRSEKGTYQAVGVAGEVGAPFTKTPTNIAARILDYTPAGFGRAVLQGISATRSQQKIVKSLGRTTTGTGIMALGAYLGHKGYIVANPPESPSEKDQWYAEGKQRNSIRLGGKWFQMDRISPMGNLLCLGAALQEISEEQRISAGMAAQGSYEALKTLTEQTFLRGASGGMKAIVQPKRYAKPWLEQMAGSMVPTISRRIGRTKDPTLRQTEGIVDAVQKKIPILRESLPPQIDIWGEPVKMTGGRGRLSLIDPFNVSPVVEDDLIKEAKRVDFTITKPGDTLAYTKMKPEEYAFYCQVYGRTLKETAMKMVNSEEYQNLSDYDKQQKWEKTTRELRSMMRESVFPALMINRFNLNKNTNSETLLKALSALQKRDDFKKASKESKEKALKDLLSMTE